MCLKTIDTLTKILEDIDIAELSKNLSSVFDDDWIELQAKKSDFILRKRSGLSGRIFLILSVLELTIAPNNSLQDQYDWLEDNFGVHLSKQSLDERYNTFAVTFMRSCFERLLSGWIKGHKITELKSGFERIFLQDSTTYQLLATMAAFYPSKDASKQGRA